jgi:deoxyribonuclease-1-like protein
LLIILAAVGSWFFFNDVSHDSAVVGGGNIAFRRSGAADAAHTSSLVGSRRPEGVIRLATFDLDKFDRQKASRDEIIDVMAQIIRQFDVVALQEVTSQEHHVIPRLVDAINGPTNHYDFVLGPHVGRFDSKEQYAYIYDRRRVDLDRYELYTIKDPDDLIHSEPLVAWFRARGVSTNDAFTFSLVNMHTDPTDGETERENGLLRSIFESVRNDRRGEDDVILLGNFQVPATELRKSARMPSAVFVVSESPTDPAHQVQRDNIIFDSMATVEFTGRSGVVDFLRKLNLTVDQARSISNHLPVWAEFSVYEGADRRRMATRPQETDTK